MTTKRLVTATNAPDRRAATALAMPTRRATREPATSKATGVAAKSVAGRAPTRQTAKPFKLQFTPALKVTVDVDPFVDVVRRHVLMSPGLAKVIKDDFMHLLQNPTLATARTSEKTMLTADTDPVLSTQEAADLVGVSRPYIVARIEAGDIPLHQQVGNQRRVLKSAVLAWNRREQARRRCALGQHGADLDSEILTD